MNMNKELNYVCKIPSVSEMEQRWDYEISLHSKKENWIVWKAEAIDHFRNGDSIPYYGILDGMIICEATAALHPDFDVANAVELCAFRTIKEYRGKGYFSELMKYMLKDLKQRGYTRAIVGVEPSEVVNKEIYDHWGFKDYISSDTETYPDGTVIQVDFYGKSLDE